MTRPAGFPDRMPAEPAQSIDPILEPVRVSELRVLHVRRVYPLLSQTFIRRTVREMERLGIDSPVAALIRTPAEHREQPAHALLDLPSRLPGGSALLERAFAALPVDRFDRHLWPLQRRWLRAQVRALRPDAILAHFGTDACMAAPVARSEGVPMAAAFYGYDVSRLPHADPALWQAVYARMWPDTDRVLGISNHVLGKLRALGCPEEKLALWRIGVDIHRFPYRDPAEGWIGPRVDCLHVGRLTAKKAPVTLVRSFAMARERLAPQIDLRLTIAGDGELAAPTRAEVERLRLGHCVRMLGAVPSTEVPKLLHDAHVYVQHCRTAPNGDMEGLGLSFVEAAATGLPIVSTLHNGIPDAVLHGRSGLLSPEGDEEAMARNLAAVAADPGLWSEMGRQGRLHVESEFSLESTVCGLVAQLRAMVSSSRARISS